MDLTLWPLVSQPWPDLCAAVDLVERLGWQGVMVEDHFMADGGGFGAVSDPRFEVTSVLSALAVATRSVRLAPLVMSATYRHPAVVANWAATVDHISRGRLTLGLGAGWQLNEHAQYGIQLGTPGERIDRLDEYCTVVRSLFEQSETDFKGRYFELSNAWCEPKPLQARLPLLIGGKGDRMLRLVARHADQWNMWAMPTVFSERSGVLDQSCEAIGRDPATVRRSTQALVCLTESESEARAFIDAAGGRAAFAGTAKQFADLAAQWHDAGVDELVIPDWHLGTGTQRAESIEAITAALRE
jgi:alkanesulfonate monooxygenase SsuD/methylene tetrahydromethanopterin reductase-like flavin-dependent oxidoreductase (luciferase family)